MKCRLLEDDVLRAPRLVRHLVAFLEVAARAERALAGAGEDHRAGVAVVLERIEARKEIFAHRGVHRVHLVGAIEGDGDDVTVGRAVDEQVPVGGGGHGIGALTGSVTWVDVFISSGLHST